MWFMISAQNRPLRLNGNSMRNLWMVFLMCYAFAKAYSPKTNEINSEVSIEATLSVKSYFQDYRTHKVMAGETLKTIAEKYGIQEKDLIALNPDVRRKFRKGLNLLIPSNSLALTQKKLENYKIHKVKKKETLYRLSKDYGVTILDIKEANKRLYAEPLQRGDEIRIPVYGKQVAVKDLSILSDPDDGFHTYVVQPSEGFYRIAENNGTTIETIKKLNPEIEELKPGMVLKVPDPAMPEDGFIEYRIPARSGMYSLKKLTGLSEDSLTTLNPELKQGFKAGMTVLIPRPRRVDSFALRSYDSKVARLVDSIQDYSVQRIAVMLPFSLNRIDTTASDKDRLKDDKALRIALDFYSGVRIARDSARILGLKIEYDLYDTQGELQAIRNILAANNFDNYTAVIGPLKSSNVAEVARSLQSSDVPVISPLTTSKVKLFKNLIQARPTDELLKARLKSFLSFYAKDKNIIIVTDNKNPQLKTEFVTLFPAARIIIPSAESNYIFKQNYLKELDSDKENLVILAVDNVGFITDATNHYASAVIDHQITVVGLDDYEDMDLSSNNLAKLNYIFPKMYKEDQDDNSFVKLYRREFSHFPNKYATRGFDVAMDVILRNASAKRLYESVVKDGMTIMAESKFDYVKQPFSGYYNEAVFLLQFQPDLTFKELHLEPENPQK